MRRISAAAASLVVVSLLAGPPPVSGNAVSEPRAAAVGATQRVEEASRTYFRTEEIDGLEIFYREAGPEDAPTIVLLHGFPTSSHLFRELIPQLSDRFHVIAPDYPGFGYSSMPSVDEFDYTFDNLAAIVEKLIDRLELTRYSLYVTDYGAPVGFRVASARPEEVETLIVQNGNAYNEGLLEFWDPVKAYWLDQSDANADALRHLFTLEATKWQYTHGVRDVEAISPDNWMHDQAGMDRPGNKAIQLQLFLDYGSNPGLYPKWQQYFREHQPPTLIVWGQGDYIFPPDGAHPYGRDLDNVELHLLDTGHMALAEDGRLIARLVRSFLAKNLAAGANSRH